MSEPRPTPVLPLAAGADSRHRLLTWVAVVSGACTLAMIGADLGPRAFLMGVVLAVVPVPIYVALALWLDRFEPEPPLTLAQTFAWGATVAVLLAVCLNTAAETYAAALLGDRAAETFGALVSAPLVEELAKGLALLFLYSQLKDEFDDVVDGVIYAAMVGLGFAMMENVQYYGGAVAEGHDSSVMTFAIRGMMAPFAHPLFTSLFGIGLGYTREKMRSARRFWAPPVGLAGAVVLHALWNLATTRDAWFVALYFAVMVPVFVGILVLVYLSLVREGRVIRQHLASLVDDGVIQMHELDRLCVVRHRLRASYLAWRSGGMQSWRRRRELHRVASELAFHRWRVGRGLTQGERADAEREAAYLAQLVYLCEPLLE